MKEDLKKMKRLLAITITALIIALVFMSSCATSTKTTEVSGTIEMASQVDNVPQVLKGAYLIYDRSVTWEVHGDLDGVWFHKGTTNQQQVTGSLTQECDSAFIGTVKGKQGTFTAKETGSGERTTGTATLTATIVNGTGKLAKISGTITVNTTDAVNGTTGIYTGRLSLGE
jgi:hypothetical protein